MSAFIVNKRHIDALITYAQQHCPKALRGTTTSKAGQALWNENYRSVNTRYRLHDKAPKYRFEPYIPSISAAQALKALHCLEYQSCEVEDNHPETYQEIYNAIHSAASHNVIGYEEAAWEITR